LSAEPSRPSSLVYLLSLLTTPVIVFVMTSNSRYLANQADLGFQSSLLLPYLGMAALTIVLGLLLVPASRFRVGRSALWLYYLAGPCYLGYWILHKLHWELTKTEMSASVELAAWLLLTAFLGLLLVLIERKRFPRYTLCRLFAVIGPVLLLTEVYNFVSQAESLETGTSLRQELGLEGQGTNAPSRSSSSSGSETRLPNIYHLILDGFQTDMFEYTYPVEERERELPGFRYFPDNVASYGRTRFSIAATFQGRLYDYESSQPEFILGEFDSNRSFLHWLEKAGYTAFGFHVMPKEDGADEALFDYAVRHGKHVALNLPSTDEMFRKLWIVSSFPHFVHGLFLSEDEVSSLRNQQVTLSSTQLKSYGAFSKYLALEEELPASGRYTFVHIMIPHPPVSLDASCALLEEGVPDGEAYVAHIGCGNKIIRDLVDRLESLGRYRDSMIVIHGDHGFYAGIKDGQLTDLRLHSESNPETVAGHTDEFASARSRALLLIKPPGAGSPGDRFAVSAAKSLLIDIAPTVLAAVGIEPEISYPGWSLLDPDQVPKDRKRYYHYYDFVTVESMRMLASEMSRWDVEKGAATKLDVVALQHTLEEKSGQR